MSIWLQQLIVFWEGLPPGVQALGLLCVFLGMFVPRFACVVFLVTLVVANGMHGV